MQARAEHLYKIESPRPKRLMVSNARGQIIIVKRAVFESRFQNSYGTNWRYMRVKCLSYIDDALESVSMG